VRRVHIEFRPAAVPGRRLWMLAAAAVLVALAALANAWHDHQAARQAHGRLAAAQAGASPAIALSPRAAEVRPYDASAREMLAERSRPWPEVLLALENTRFVGIRLKAVELSSGEYAVGVLVAANDNSALLAWVDALKAGQQSDASSVIWSVDQVQTEPGGQGVQARLTARRAKGPSGGANTAR
jgi:hypothetical protein